MFTCKLIITQYCLIMNLIIIFYGNEVFIIFISIFYRLVARMSELTAIKAKLWNYRKDFNMLGFISVESKPMCLECGSIITNDSMRKDKLEHHQKSMHPSSVGKGMEYLENNYNYTEDEYCKSIGTQTKLFGL